MASVVRTAGFTPVDLGALTAARVIEDIPVAVFTSWRAPFFIHLAIFIFLYALSFAKYQVNQMENVISYFKLNSTYDIAHYSIIIIKLYNVNDLANYLKILFYVYFNTNKLSQTIYMYLHVEKIYHIRASATRYCFKF